MICSSFVDDLWMVYDDLWMSSCRRVVFCIRYSAGGGSLATHVLTFGQDAT